MSEVTQHGNNIADQIDGEDAYGATGVLTTADLWVIVNAAHSQYLANGLDNSMLSRWMEELESADEDLPPL